MFGFGFGLLFGPGLSLSLGAHLLDHEREAGESLRRFGARREVLLHEVVRLAQPHEALGIGLGLACADQAKVGAACLFRTRVVVNPQLGEGLEERHRGDDTKKPAASESLGSLRVAW